MKIYNTPTNNSETLEQYQGYLESQRAFLAGLEELLIALKDYDKKTINKRFFEKYFSWINEEDSYNSKKGELAKDWQGNICTRYKLNKPKYDFQEGKEIYITKGKTIEIKEDWTNREHLIELIEEYKRAGIKTLESYKKQIEKLESFNEDNFLEDMKALYKKYNKPTNWRELLKSIAWESEKD